MLKYYYYTTTLLHPAIRPDLLKSVLLASLVCSESLFLSRTLRHSGPVVVASLDQVCEHNYSGSWCCPYNATSFDLHQHPWIHHYLPEFEGSFFTAACVSHWLHAQQCNSGLFINDQNQGRIQHSPAQRGEQWAGLMSLTLFQLCWYEKRYQERHSFKFLHVELTCFALALLVTLAIN